MYYIGERDNSYQEVIISGDLNSGKYVVFYVYGDEVTGVLTCGYQNLHLYLWEAMKQMVMPPASAIRSRDGDFKSIVKMIIAMSHEISGQRQALLGIPSVIRAEFTRERDQIDILRKRINSNLADENSKQKSKVKELKEKYDREGVEFVEDEAQMGRQETPGDTEI